MIVPRSSIQRYDQGIMGAGGLPRRVLGTGRTAEAGKSMLEEVGQGQLDHGFRVGAADGMVLLIKVKAGERT